MADVVLDAAPCRVDSCANDSHTSASLSRHNVSRVGDPETQQEQYKTERETNSATANWLGESDCESAVSDSDDNHMFLLADRRGVSVTYYGHLEPTPPSQERIEITDDMVAKLDMRFQAYETAEMDESRAVQRLLQLAASNPNACAPDRFTAYVLSIWIGCNDIDVLSLLDPESNFHWLAPVLSWLMQQYPLTWDICNSIDLLHVYESVHHLFANLPGEERKITWS